MSKLRTPIPVALGLAGMLTATTLHAAPEAPPADLEKRLAELQQQMDDWKAYREQTEKKLLEQQQQIQSLQSQLPPKGSVPPSAAAGLTPSTGPNAAPPPPGTPTISQTPTDSNPATQSRTQNVAAALDQPGVLTPRGKFVLEPSLQYSYSSSDRVALIGYTIIPAITIGLIDVRKVNRTTWVGALTGRYGLTNRLELEARLPYVYQTEDSVNRGVNVGTANDTVFNTHGNNIGDVELAMRYQFNQPVDGPYYIGNLRLKSATGKGPFDIPYDASTGLPLKQTTGSGFWSLQAGVSTILPSDPAVYFGTLSYTKSLKRSVDQDTCASATAATPFICSSTHFGEVAPGDVIGLNFGMGIGINDRASFSVGYDHSYIFKTKVDGQTPPGTTPANVGVLQFGYAYRLNAQSSLSMTLGVGVTQESPDVQLTLRVPYTF